MKTKLLIAALSFIVLTPPSFAGGLPSMDFLKRGMMHCLDGKDACTKHAKVCSNKIIFNMCVKECLIKRRTDAKTELIKKELLKCPRDFIAQSPHAKVFGITPDTANDEDDMSAKKQAQDQRDKQRQENAAKRDAMREKYGLQKK